MDPVAIAMSNMLARRLRFHTRRFPANDRPATPSPSTSRIDNWHCSTNPGADSSLAADPRQSDLGPAPVPGMQPKVEQQWRNILRPPGVHVHHIRAHRRSGVVRRRDLLRAIGAGADGATPPPRERLHELAFIPKGPARNEFRLEPRRVEPCHGRNHRPGTPCDAPLVADHRPRTQPRCMNNPPRATAMHPDQKVPHRSS